MEPIMSKKTVQFSITAVISIVLLALAHLAASQMATRAQLAVVPDDLNYFRVIFSIVVTILLITPALCLFLFQGHQGPSDQWRNLYSFAYVAYMIHLYWAIFGMMGGDFSMIFGHPELVMNPTFDSLVTAWWTLDVVLAWTVARNLTWVRMERGALQIALAVGFVGSAITKGEGLMAILGYLMALVLLVAVVLRIVILDFDPNSVSAKIYVGSFWLINRIWPWHILPTWMGILNLGAYRETLRAKNLCNTSGIPVTNPQNATPVPPFDPAFLMKRHDDGYYDDLSKPSMGGASINTQTVAPVGPGTDATHDSMYFNKSQPGARFGRNVPLSEAFPDEANLLNPSPRVISNELLARDTFKPAVILNLLAAAWIQFETHDWFNHGEPPWEGEKEDKKRRNEPDPITEAQYRPHLIPLTQGDQWHECPMRVRPTRPDVTRDYDQERRENHGRLKYPETYVNAESHWWDGSQIYGSNPQTTHRLRSDYRKDEHGNLLKDPDGGLIPTGELLPDGKLFLTKEGLSLDPSTGTALSGFTGNWWLGLSLLHTLFTREHNAICDRVRLEYPGWSSDEIFRVARLVTSALIAKIHTIEWTPAILTHPALQVGMAANWWGLLSENVKKAFGRVSQNEAFSGIPGSGVDHGISVDSGIPGPDGALDLTHDKIADYCLTEEFVSVYRLHPLMPDDLHVLSARDGHAIKTYVLPDGVVGDQARLTALTDGATMSDLFYSFGVANPGAVMLHNYPNFLRQLKRPEAFGVSEVVDLGSIDILRDRERGVPRYNRFLRLLHREPIKSFDDFNNPKLPGLAEDLRRIYGKTPDGKDNVELLDLMVGMFAEVPPEGFGFSDTAFRIFILMASRRIKSDRFLAGDGFIPDVYTQVGLDWLENTSMSDILLRHYPELGPSLYGVKNAFAPWKRVETSSAAPGSRAVRAESGQPMGFAPVLNEELALIDGRRRRVQELAEQQPQE
jgi:Animal haem peroxidase